MWMLLKHRGFEVFKVVNMIQDISCRIYTAESCLSWLSAVWTAVWANPSWFVDLITYLLQQCFPESCSANFLPHAIAYSIKDAAMFMMHTYHQHEFCHPQHAMNSALVILQLNHLSKFHHSSHDFDYSHCTCATWKPQTMSVLFSFWTVFHPSTCLITKANEIPSWNIILCMNNNPYGAEPLGG